MSDDGWRQTFAELQAAQAAQATQAVVQGNPIAGAISAVGDAVSVRVPLLAKQLVMHVTGSAAGLDAVFEATLNGTDWFPTSARPVGGLTADGADNPGVASVAQYGAFAAFSMQVFGFRMARLRATAITSGTANWLLSFA